MNRSRRGILEEAGAGADKLVTIQDLQKQLGERAAELHCVGEALARDVIYAVDTTGELTDITDRVRAEAQREQAAADAERERLSCDLHDAVTQTLFSIAAIAEVLPDMWERDPEHDRRRRSDQVLHSPKAQVA